MRMTYETMFGIFGAILIALFLYVTYGEEHPSFMAVQKTMYEKAYERARTKFATAKDKKDQEKYAALMKTNSHPRIELRQIVLRTGEAERCITCHVDEDEIEEQHGAQMTGDFPRDIYGCAACHGGDGRSTLEETAHFGLVRTRDEMLDAALYAESPCAFCHVDKPLLLAAHPSTGGLDAGIMLNCTTCHVHKDKPDIQKRVLPHLELRVNKEQREKVHIAFSGQTPKTKMYAFWKRMRALTPQSGDPILSPVPTFREFNITGDRLRYRGSEFCKACHTDQNGHEAVMKYTPSTLEHTHFWMRSKFRTFEVVKKQDDFLDPPPTYPLDPFYQKTEADVEAKCVSSTRTRPSWCPRRVTPKQYRQTCLQCHTTGYDPATHTYLEEGVTCEACHGPGQYFGVLMQMGLNHFLFEQDRKLKHLNWEEEIESLKDQLAVAQQSGDQAEINRLNAAIKGREKEEPLSVFRSSEYTDVEGNTRVAYMGTFYAQSGATISRIADDRNVCIRCHVANYHEMRPKALEERRLAERPGKGYQAVALPEIK